MSRFASAFAEGQAVADAEQNARNEIAGVIAQLRLDIQMQSGGQIEIAVGESIAEFFDLKEVDVASLGHQNTKSAWLPRQQWLMACNPRRANAQWVRLARIDFEPVAYPVAIIYDKVNTRCHDRGALEVALEDLLKSPWCGERLLPLLQREPAIASESDKLSDVGEANQG